MSAARELFLRRLPRAVWRASAWRGLEVVHDVAYAADPRCRLDILVPAELTSDAPIALYIHGGGFRLGSKETHGYAAARYASAGFLTFNVSYRLAPEHPYPAAVEDVHAAYAWVVEHAARFGGDPRRVLVAGESAGGNLALGLCLSATLEREETWARRVRQLGIAPAAAHIAYGFLQTQGRDASSGLASGLVDQRIGVICADYLGGTEPGVPTAYADPMRIVDEAPGARLARLPPVLALCGSWDVIAQDTRRLVKRLREAGAPVEAVWVHKAVHGFHALPGRRSERAWRALLDHAHRTVMP